MARLPPDRVAGMAGRTALCLDFDGTLAPIVDDPEAAAPLPGTTELLGRLAGRFAAVAWRTCASVTPPLSRNSAVILSV